MVVNPLSSPGKTSQACVHRLFKNQREQENACGAIRPLVAGCSMHHLANVFGVQNTDNKAEVSAALCCDFISVLIFEGFL